jgi:GntR family transcriptional regulator
MPVRRSRSQETIAPPFIIDWRPPDSRSRSSNSLLDLGRNMVPIYVQLVTVFRRLVENGQWALNAQIPTLDKIAEEFGVAKATVRQAIGFLEREGLLQRHRRRGTFVIGQLPHKIWYRIPTDWIGAVKAYDDLSCTWTESKREKILPIVHHATQKMAKEYQGVRAMYHRDGVPLLIETVTLDRKLFSLMGGHRLTNRSIVKCLYESHGKRIEQVDQTLVVGTSDTETSFLLKVPINSPIAIVNRTILGSGGSHICESEGLYRGDVVRIDEKITL